MTTTEREDAPGPLVSVLVSIYNRAQYLDEAVRSVLADQGAALEVVLIDDGSTDGADVIAESFADRAVVLHQPNRGCAAAWNLGLAHARGDLVAFCDSDDVWVPDHTKVLLAALEADPDAEVALGLTSEFVSPELEEGDRVTRAPQVVCRLPVVGAMLARRTVFDTVGAFDETLRQGFWFDWYARLVEADLRTAEVDTVVLRRRLHAQNSSIMQSDLLGEYARALHSAIVRRRTKGMSGANS